MYAMCNVSVLIRRLLALLFLLFLLSLLECCDVKQAFQVVMVY